MTDPVHVHPVEHPSATAMRPGAWTAIILAGNRPESDPLAGALGPGPKALLPIAGEPMLARVARAVLDAPSVGRILVVAQDPGALASDPALSWMEQDARIRFATSGNSISQSVRSAAAGEGWRVVVTTADHPLLTPATIESFIRGAGRSDVAVGLVDRKVLEGAYPGSQRTWLRFRGGDYTGANLFAIQSPAADPLIGFWASVERDRKKLWRIAARAGPLMLFGLLTRTITLEQAVRALGRRFGAEARPVLLAEAEAGVDVDKPVDHAFAERILFQRMGRAG